MTKAFEIFTSYLGFDIQLPEAEEEQEETPAV